MTMSGPTIDHREIRHWAESHEIVPIETLPHFVDHEPATLQLVHRNRVPTAPNFRRIGLG